MHTRGVIDSLALVLIVSGQLLHAQAKVMKADAGWTVKSKTLLRGQQLPVSEPIVFTKTNPGKASALLLDCPGEGIHFYACPSGSCRFTACGNNASAKLGNPVSASHGVRKRLSELLDDREPHGYVTAAARATNIPNDALLLSDSRGIHWGPALRRVLEGRYCITLKRLGAQSKPTSFTVNWDSSVDPEGVMPVLGLQPGGYSLEKGRHDSCKTDADIPPAWIVITAQPQFGTLNADWLRTTSELEKLADVASPDAILTARHAYLAGLADVVEKQSHLK